MTYKKDDTLSFCVDFWRLSALIKRDAYQIVRMNKCTDSLRDATVFSTIDCNQGYSKVETAQRTTTRRLKHATTVYFGLPA